MPGIEGARAQHTSVYLARLWAASLSALGSQGLEFSPQPSVTKTRLFLRVERGHGSLPGPRRPRLALRTVTCPSPAPGLRAVDGARVSEWVAGVSSRPPPRALRGASPAAPARARPSSGPGRRRRRGGLSSAPHPLTPPLALALAGRRADPGSGLRESGAPFPAVRSNIKPDKATANHHSFQMYTFDRATNCKACRMFLR